MDNLSNDLSEILNSQLQSTRSGRETLLLEFYWAGDLFFLCFDFSTKYLPVRVLSTAPKILKAKKPVGLFVEANLVGHRLRRVVVEGFKLILIFDDSRLTVWWQESGLNLKAQTPEKSIHWRKPQEALPWPNTEIDGARDTISKPLKAGQNRDDNPRLRLSKTLAKVEMELAAREDNRWRRLAEALEQRVDVPEDLKKLCDPRLSYFDQMNEAFRRAKRDERKLLGTRARRDELLKKLEQTQIEGVETASKPSKSTQQTGEFSARKLERPQGVVVYVGKSARDNLELLRKSQPWYLWLHLRDHPASHCVVQKPKSLELPQKELHEILEWYITMNFKSKFKQHVGEKFDVVVAECRYVKPVKGALGLVTYKKEKIVRHSYAGRKPSSTDF